MIDLMSSIVKTFYMILQHEWEFVNTPSSTTQDLVSFLLETSIYDLKLRLDIKFCT